MTFAQFLEAFNPVLQAFDAKKFPPIVLERIHTKVDDLTPNLMRELCNEIIDQCEHAPRTAKVSELANLIRSRHRNGVREEQFDIEPLCAFCNDLRSIRAVSTDGSHESLMLCECTTLRPDPCDWPLPVWSRQWAPLYRKEKCPNEWFTPITVRVRDDGSLELKDQNHNKIYWTEKIKIAIQFWQQMKKDSEGA